MRENGVLIEEQNTIQPKKDEEKVTDSAENTEPTDSANEKQDNTDKDNK